MKFNLSKTLFIFKLLLKIAEVEWKVFTGKKKQEEDFFLCVKIFLPFCLVATKDHPCNIVWLTVREP